MNKSIAQILPAIILFFLVFFPHGTAHSRISPQNAYDEGIKAFEAGDFRSAMTRWHQAIWYAIREKQQNGWEMTAQDYQIGALAYIYEGLTYQKMGEDGLAIVDFRNAEKWADGFSDIQLNIASQYFNVEMFDDTIRICKKVIHDEPKNGQAHYLMGFAFYRKDDLTAARESALKAKEYGYPFSNFLVEKLEGETKKSPAKNLEEGREELSASFLPLAAKYYEQGKYDQTIEICQKILQSEPKNGTAHYYLGYAYYAKNQNEKAFEHAKLAKENGVPYADLLIEKLEKKK